MGNADTLARSFIAKLAAHDFTGATSTFDEKMRSMLPTPKLEAIWSSLEAQAGAFGRVDSVDVKESGELRVATAKATFARAPLVLRVVFAADGRVTGFFVAPGDTAAAWQPPAYANPDAFEEKRVTVGSAPPLPGTLTIPKGATRAPAVVLVHGSGPNDEDETIGPNKVFKDLAWGLASRGIVVLRWDKRTRVAPSVPPTQREEVENDAHAAIALVRALPEVDPARVALLGHSQGAYLAPRVAKSDPAVRRLVLLAAPTRPLEDSLVAQLRYLAAQKPGDEKLKAALEAAERFKTTVESPTLREDDELALPVGGGALRGSYFLDVRGYHPERVAAKLGIPILVLQGASDYQVTAADDLPAWKRALAHDAKETVREYDGLNHLFMRGDYETPGHVDEKVVDDVAAFLSHP